MQVTFSVDWIIELSRNMRLVASGMWESLALFHKDAITIVKDRSDELFKNYGSNVQNWPTRKPLSPTTLKMREKRTWYYKKSPNNPWVLRWTGNLQNSAVKSSDKNEWSLTYTADYAIKHQRWDWVPRRKIIDIDSATSTKIIKALQKIVNEKIGIFWKQK